MKKRLIFTILLAAGCLLLLNCPDGTSGGVGGTATEPPAGTVIVIGDFREADVNVAPGGDWLVGCSTNYVGGDNAGVVVKALLGENVIQLMETQLGVPDTSGTVYIGYSYAQISYTAPADGTISFDYYHYGSGSDFAPLGTLEFWLDLDLAEIETPGTTTWTNDVKADTIPFLSHNEAVTAGTTYRLTWKIVKDWNEHAEDHCAITNIRFEY